MAKLNFEEYRQPWETGPHWELKREFMEKYQDDFPEDRLLCLAQAYSNIELLHCSYPDPVMLQIHELSKPLLGCKRFREVKKNFPEPELRARPPGKRSAPDDVQKPFKFIKFCTVGSSQVTNSSSTEDNISADVTKLNSSSEDKTTSSLTTPSASLNVSSSINSTPSLELSDGNIKSKLLILTLSKSPDFKLIKKIAAERSNLQIKSKDAIEELERLVDLLNLQKLVHYKFENTSLGNKPVFVCEFYIGGTLISIGRCATEKNARFIAASYALEILMNVSNLPVKTLNDLKITTDKNDLCFLQKFLQEVTKDSREKLCSSEKIFSAVSSLKCPSDVTFFTREDNSCPLNSRIYYCDLVINKILICNARRTGKKKAKMAAADLMIPLLVEFFKELPEGTESKVLDQSSTLCTNEDPIVCARLKTVNKLTTDSYSSGVDKSKESASISKSVIDNNNCVPLKKDIKMGQPPVKDPNTSIVGSPFVNPSDIRINYKLLNNSLEKKFVILDTVTPDTQIDTPQKTLNHSAQFCKKSLSYDLYDCDSIPGGPLFRCDLIFDGENIGFGAGFTKGEAKITAAVAALQSLEKQFYTIKVKSELDESFIIKRDQMMHTNAASDAVSDSNVGCRMLKMMGWTGGGIGKTGGITEPIMASEHRFQQGLGFEDKSGDMKKFQKNIESLLREFSQTDTTSDLIFCTDFTKPERKIIHKIACRFGLIGNSKGREEKRQLFVKHKMTVTELLNHLVRAGGSTHKYELVDKST